jgi:hypothetical protein
MAMKRAFPLIATIIAWFSVGIGLNSVRADPNFMDFNGAWQGSGTDRDLPFETTQRTSCRATVDANLRTMNSLMSCSGDAGLRKDIRLNIILDGDAFAGSLTQKATTPGTSVTVLDGSVYGHVTNTTADFRVDFPGLMPKVTVTLRRDSASSFSMQASVWGAVLMDVTFDRTVKP